MKRIVKIRKEAGNLPALDEIKKVDAEAIEAAKEIAQKIEKDYGISFCDLGINYKYSKEVGPGFSDELLFAFAFHNEIVNSFYVPSSEGIEIGSAIIHLVQSNLNNKIPLMELAKIVSYYKRGFSLVKKAV